ncbi:cartenoid oxygenase, putative, partial [Perkinsus marinus ATCC 50983]
MTPFVSLEDFKYSKQAPGLLMRFHPQLPSRLVIIPRDGGGPVRECDIQACHIFHFAHCDERREGGEVVIEVSALCLPEEFTMEFKDKLFLSNSNDAPGQMYNFSLRFSPGENSIAVETSRLGGRACGEFPTVHPLSHVAPASNRYIYLMGNTSKRIPFTSIIKMDRQKPESPIGIWISPSGCTVGEPVFCPRIGTKGIVPRSPAEEDDGYLVVQVYDSAKHSTYFVLLDARHVSEGPVCELHTNTFITNGFHGTWSDELIGLGEST